MKNWSRRFPVLAWLAVGVLVAVAAVLTPTLWAQAALDVDLTVDTTTVRPRTGEVTSQRLSSSLLSG